MNASPTLRRVSVVRPAPRFLAPSPRIQLVPCIAAAFGGAYVLRASLAAYVGTEWTMSVVAQSSAVTLAAACLVSLIGGIGRPDWRGAALLAATAASLWHCETFSYSLVRWAGWSLMLITIGPLNNTQVARRFRNATAQTLTAAFVGATLCSAVWWLAGLPNLGRGDFTGVLWHSMTMGPVAAIAALLALSRAASGGKPLWYAVFAASVLVTTLAASRSALAAMALGVLTVALLKLGRRPIVSCATLFIALVVAASPDTTLNILATVLPDKLTAGLARKSWEHTREVHWEARWDEFYDSPVVGVGFASGWEGTAGHNDETNAIETGSSYLSLLSMTGMVGILAFLLLVVSTAQSTRRNWCRLSELQKLESSSLAGFWVVHLGAEGYIYAVGSLMGLAFWLWMGRLHDQLSWPTHTAKSVGSILSPGKIAGGKRTYNALHSMRRAA